MVHQNTSSRLISFTSILSAATLVLVSWLLSVGAVFSQMKEPSTRLERLDKMLMLEVNRDPASIYDSAWAQIRMARSEGQLSYESHAHIYLSYIWNWHNDLDSSLYHARVSLDLAVRHGDKADLASGYNTLGSIYDLRGEPDSAISAYLNSLDWAKKSHDDRYVARANLNLGMVYRTQGNYPQSLAYLRQAEEICICREYAGYLPNLYLNLGGVYQQLGDEEKASDGFHRGLRHALNLDRPRTVAANMEALGDHALAIQDTLEALCWYQSSLQVATEADVLGQVGQSSAKAAMVMLDLGMEQDAAEAAALAVKMAQQARDTVNLCRAEYALGKVNLRSGRSAAAVDHCERAYAYARLTRQTPVMLDICDCLWRSAEQAGQPALALRHHREWVHLRDSLYSNENSLAIARLETQVEYARQHAADSVAQVAADMQREASYRQGLQAAHNRSRRTLWITAVAILLALAALGTLIVFRQKNQQLLKQNETIQHQNAAINAALEEKEVLLREVHHRVKNNLQMMVSLLDMQAQQAGDSEALEVLLASKGRVQAMTLIHQKLYQQENIAVLAFGTYLQQLVEGVRDLYPDGGRVQLEYALVDGDFGIDTALPLGLILNELVTNAFKHAYAGRAQGRLRLTLRQLAAAQYALIVEDDGPGLPEGLDPARSQTLGLQLVAGLARQLRGQLSLGRSEWGGCRIEIQFAPAQRTA